MNVPKNVRIKKSNIIIIVTIILIILIGGISLLIRNNKYNKVIDTNFYVNQKYYIGQKDESVFLIDSNLNSKKIYDINIGKRLIIVKNNVLYVIYDSYVDVFDLKAGTLKKITEQQIINNKIKDISEIYYYKGYDLYHKDFRNNNKENIILGNEKDNFLYYIDNNLTLVKENIKTNEKESIIKNVREFVVGKNKIYYLRNDNAFCIYNVKNNNNEIIKNYYTRIRNRINRI